MRVISGKIKGIKLKQRGSREVRPVASRVKKSLFSIIEKKLNNSYFLDLYAGTGSIGIEALSRGAKESTFIDNGNIQIKTISENIKKTNFSNCAKVYKLDVFIAIKIFFNESKKFDIIFLGPPFLKNKVNPTLEYLYKNNILKKNGLIIVHHHYKEEIKFNGFELFRQKKYGDNLVSFLKIRE